MKNMLLRSTLLLLCLFCLTGLFAQFGVSGFYVSSRDDLAVPMAAGPRADLASPGNGFEASLDYWFRLKNKRIEFLPTLSYGRFADDLDLLGDGVPNSFISFSLTELGVQFKTNFYLFDFGTDCDCPTFGKQGPALHKGFFLQVAPGYSHFRGSASYNDPLFDPDVPQSFKNTQGLFNLGLAAGIDFGISNLITLSPQVGYRHYFGDFDWSEVEQATPGIVEEPLLQAGRYGKLLFGIRLGIRLDERRY